ncbi:low molecular weight protein-tyrosine-phosphatase [Acaryochloris sp. CCMEE 5410]|uniref:low molecular weight protein-tyrosine-phosphatase n=1 Tax=Acaryochloris sp. CCMEE 5410 TaxID=310037 RepID=UPI0002484763|nr:low molecular weight protein-tyrosine-phosphatase [Acaryochloris sp. CCMEE 5410]KAI9134839.1 low molecular weight phosphotyrosine protein phosphatase [Acaryochloris sp. CCMEE 5410]
MPQKLLFVCLGNICRSPSAEGIMNHLLQQEQLTHQYQCDSAGTSSYHIGASPDRRMAAAGLRQDIVLTGNSRQVQPEDFADFDLILAMDRQNYRDLVAMNPDEQYADKIQMMCDFCSNFADKEVPDPYYGGPSGFDYVIDLLLDACSGLLDHLQQA